jgi:hypothetical protein
VSGYHLRLARDGTWSLYAEDLLGANETLASGSVEVGDAEWHRLALSFHGNRIAASIDDVPVAAVEHDGHRTGQIGLRTPFQVAQFDDVLVTPSGPAPLFAPKGAMTATATSEQTANTGGYEHSVPNAIDGRPETMWHSLLSPPAPLPQAITLELDRARRVEGLVYRPRLDGNARGMIGSYEVLLSDDGESFQPVAEGSWPLSTGTKVATWRGQSARYVRLVATGAGSCGGAAAASELDVITGAAPEPTGDATPDVPPFDAYVPHDEMTATASSIFGPGFEAARAIDGDCATFWHTAPAATDPLPATLTLDLGRERSVEGITYLPRQDGNGNGFVTAYNVYVSTDGTTFTKVAGGTFTADALRKWVRWQPTAARYLRFEPTAGTANVASVATMEVAVAEGGAG